MARSWGARPMEHYVETFDRLCCCPYLTHYAVATPFVTAGGAAGLQAGARGGRYELTTDELPDYLPAVLELSDAQRR